MSPREAERLRESHVSFHRGYVKTGEITQSLANNSLSLATTHLGNGLIGMAGIRNQSLVGAIGEEV